MKKIFTMFSGMMAALVTVGVSTKIAAADASAGVHNLAQIQAVSSGQVANIAQISSGSSATSVHNTAQIVSQAANSSTGGSSWIVALAIVFLAAVALYAFYNQEKLQALVASKSE